MIRKTLTMWAALSLCAAGMITGAASAADRHVPFQYETIQEAIDAAVAGDVVIVADGTYTGLGNRDITFNGKAITVKSANGPEHCIIDCQGTQAEPARGFHFGSGEGPDSVLDGFTICNGSTPPGAVLDQFNGGGIMLNNASSPTIRNCIITNNWCGCWGGAVSCGWDVGSNPTLINCVITGNESGEDGGAVFALGSSPTLINCTITDNGAVINGGAICNFGSGVMTLENCTIAGNEAPNGSAIFGWGSNVVVKNSIVRDNPGTVHITSGVTDVSFSNVTGGFEGPGNVDIDPMFAAPVKGDYHLLPGSPMIDAGDPLFDGTGLVDFDGNPRVVNGIVDIGADEALKVSDLTQDGLVDTLDVLELFGAWGACDGCAADLNGDGTVGVIDLLQMFGEWGP